MIRMRAGTSSPRIAIAIAAVAAAVAAATGLHPEAAFAASPYLGEVDFGSAEAAATPCASTLEPSAVAGAVEAAAAAVCRMAVVPVAVDVPASFEIAVGAPVVVELPADFEVVAGPTRTPRPAVAPTPPIPPTPAVPPSYRLPRLGLPTGAWYGVSLRCSDCSMEREGETRAFEWHFRSAPEIVEIEPDSPAERAGVRRGDVLTHVDGIPITSREAGRRFGAAKAGDKLRWTVRLGNKTRDVTIVAGERPQDEGDDFSAMRAELRAAQEAFEAQREKLRELNLDEARLEELRAAHARLADVARSLADLERERAVLAPKGLFVIPDDLADLPDDERVRIVGRDVHVLRDGHRLRYSGEIGDSRVEVRGSSAVVVTEEKNGDLVIDTPDASIRVKKNKN